MRKKEPEWLSDAVFYQIYPQSFFDTNGDGIGDLRGIIKKLPYIERLGCTAIWINPCFESPFQDAGYDVSDYYRIAPRYGTNDDMKELVKAAKKRGIRVLLDFVPGHTSTEHPWFKESCRAEKNRHSNWFVWTDSVWTGNVKNLRMVNGYAERDGNYITNFFYCQPALNYGFAKPDPNQKWQLPVNNPDILALRKEMTRVMRFWLDMGVSGFRVDMAGSLVKNDPEKNETSKFWRGVRKMLDREYPDAVLVSEWSDPEKAIPAGFHSDFLLSFSFCEDAIRSLYRPRPANSPCFFDRRGKGNIKKFLDAYMRLLGTTRRQGYMSLVSGNHDMSRVSNGRDMDDLKVFFAFLLTMPGVPFIYYGDELGMRTLKLVSKEGGYNRTGSRTPMQWNGNNNAGFSTAKTEKLYLPIDSSRNRPDVESQLHCRDSLLQTVMRLIRLRKKYKALQADGEFKPLYARAGRYPLVYIRQLGGETIIVVINPAGRSAKASINNFPVGNMKVISGVKPIINRNHTRVEIVAPPVAYSIIKI